MNSKIIHQLPFKFRSLISVQEGSCQIILQKNITGPIWKELSVEQFLWESGTNTPRAITKKAIKKFQKRRKRKLAVSKLNW